jgi:hypothetical protein
MSNKILIGAKKEEVAQLIYELGRDQTKTFNIAYKELCQRLSIERNDESEEIFRKYRRTLTNLEKTATHFYERMWRPAPISFNNDDPNGKWGWGNS